MFRKVLMSALVLGALAATVGGATYAPWDDTATGTGTISAATIDVTIDGSGAASIVFAPQNLLPNETSSSSFTINNIGSRAVNVSHSVVVTSSNDGQCSFTNLVEDGSSSFPASIPASNNGGATLVMRLNSNAPESCMGITFTVVLTVTGTGV